MNVVIRKELRLYASNLRKAVAAHVASSPAEPDMGLAHKRVDTSSTSYKMLRLVLHVIALLTAIMLAHVRQHISGPDTAGNLKSTVNYFDRHSRLLQWNGCHIIAIDWLCSVIVSCVVMHAVL